MIPPRKYSELPGTSVSRWLIRPPVQLSAVASVRWCCNNNCPTTTSNGSWVMKSPDGMARFSGFSASNFHRLQPDPIAHRLSIDHDRHAFAGEGLIKSQLQAIASGGPLRGDRNKMNLHDD